MRSAECGTSKGFSRKERNARAGDSQVCVAGQLVCPVKFYFTGVCHVSDVGSKALTGAEQRTNAEWERKNNTGEFGSRKAGQTRSA